MTIDTAHQSPSPGFLLDELGYIDEDEAAVGLNIETKTLASYRKEGVGPEHTVVARRILYSKEALAEWLRAGGAKGREE